MNIQQLRYVVAIANSGTFREAAEKMYVSQPSLSISVRDLEKELGFKIFRRTSSGTFLTRRGMEFYEKAQELVKGFDVFQNQYANPEEEKDEFYDTDDTAYIPFERLVYEGDVISYTDSSIETVTEVEENGDFYTKITSMPKLPLKNMD